MVAGGLGIVSNGTSLGAFNAHNTRMTGVSTARTDFCRYFGRCRNIGLRGFNT
jgi:hypothetical protein